eukprot:scaffold20935_cov69-Phaeocystis_antarctica.AAC.11
MGVRVEYTTERPGSCALPFGAAAAFAAAKLAATAASLCAPQIVAHLHLPQHVPERDTEQPCEVARRLVLAREQEITAAFNLELPRASKLDAALARFLTRPCGADFSVERVARVPEGLARLRLGQVSNLPCHVEQCWFRTNWTIGKHATRPVRRPNRLVDARLPTHRRRFDLAHHVAA